MSYTALRVTERGVVLLAGHLARFEASGDEAVRQFRAFAASAEPGLYAAFHKSGQFGHRRIERSLLHDGQPVRYAVSPFVTQQGRFPKPAPPNRYADVRVPDIATLLTSDDGAELYESCVAAIFCWDGHGLVVPPSDRPRVESVVENALRAAGSVREAPILRNSSMPLALANAMGGIVVPQVPGRDPFPPEARALVDAVLVASTLRV